MFLPETVAHFTGATETKLLNKKCTGLELEGQFVKET